MKILKNLLIALVALAVLLVIIGLFLPSTAHVERSTVIAAPQPTVFALVNGFGRFNEWSPWAEKDPDTRYAYEGPRHGVGARMSWASDHPDVGSGSQEITASEPFDHLVTALDFGPQGTADAFFALSPADGGTRVVWGFDTDFGSNLVGRYFGLMFDRWIGPDYEKGLLSLKSLAEGLPQADWSDLEVETTTVEPVTIAYVSTSSSPEPQAIGQAHAAAYGQVGAFLGRHSLEQAGPPLTINTSWSDAEYGFDAGIPLAAAPEAEVAEDSAVQVGATYGGEVVKVVHRGAYTELSATHEKIEAYVAAHGLEVADRSWHEWKSDPGSTPEEELVTNIYYPVK